MSAELIGILSVGVALAALLLTSIKGIREDVRRVENRLDALERRMEPRLDALEPLPDALEQRMARLERVLDGLREALFGRTREADEPEIISQTQVLLTPN